MYTDFFGFRELPFNNTPDPRFFFPTPDHEEALASLIYAVSERKGFVLLTGEVGAGKTLVTRMMLRHFGNQIAFANINHAVQNADDLMEAICTEFELRFKAGSNANHLVRVLHDYLLSEFAQNIPVVLVLDEAQNLSIESFERLRMIGNLEADDAKLLQIAIVGQPELQRTFVSPELRQLRQRVFRSFHIPSLSRDNAEAYIRHRLSVVTESYSGLFEDDAFEVIYKVSHGLPRIINTVCDNALLSAYSADRHHIDASFIESVVGQMMLIGEGKESKELIPSARPRPSGRPRPQPYSASRSTRSTKETVARPQPHTGPKPVTHSTRLNQANPSPKPVFSKPPEIQTLIHRISLLEDHLQERSPTPKVERSQRDEKDNRALQGLRGEVDVIIRDLGSRIEAGVRRLEALEHRVESAPVNLLEIRRARSSLESLIKQSRSVATGVETSKRELERREGQLRLLGSTVKSIAGDLQYLLDRTSVTVSKTNKAERGARTVLERLVLQSKHSRQLIDELTRSTFRLTSSTPTDRSGPQRIKQGSALTSSLPIPNADTDSPQIASDETQQTLDYVRKSLSELRGIAHDGRTLTEQTKTGNEVLPTTLLANQVENLLGMIDSES